jgi:hypothetical protein
MGAGSGIAPREGPARRAFRKAANTPRVTVLRGASWSAAAIPPRGSDAALAEDASGSENAVVAREADLAGADRFPRW